MYEIDDLDGAMLHPRWLMLPVMLLNPFEISRTEFAWPNWQNNMLIKCVQLSMPLLNLSLSYFITILLKISFGKMPIIWAKSDNFTMGLRIFCGAKQNYRFWRKPAPFFIFSKNYFGRMWKNMKYEVQMWRCAPAAMCRSRMTWHVRECGNMRCYYCYELWVMSYELWVMSDELWVMSYGLWLGLEVEGFRGWGV